MNVVDLFSGLGGWAEPFIERGHTVITTDLDPSFERTITANVMDEDLADRIFRALEEEGGRPAVDIVVASPPCEGFTVMNIGKNWTRPTDDPPNAPRTPAAWQALKLVQRTRALIRELDPTWFVIENPRGKLRRLSAVGDLERRTVTYCQYGLTSQKPTDLWGGFPPSLEFRPTCSRGAPCHVAAPRGSRTPGSIQGISGPRQAALRAKIPFELALAVCLAAERDQDSPGPSPMHVNALADGQGSLFLEDVR